MASAHLGVPPAPKSGASSFQDDRSCDLAPAGLWPGLWPRLWPGLWLVSGGRVLEDHPLEKAPNVQHDSWPMGKNGTLCRLSFADTVLFLFSPARVVY